MSEITEETMPAPQFFMSEKINEIAGALAKAQGEMGGAKKDAVNPHLKNKYADLASVMDALKKPLSDNGLALTQLIEDEDDKVAVRTILTHSSGQWYMSRASLPTTGNKGVNEAQAMGSVISYLRRYQASAITGLHQEDDDAASAKDKKAKPKEEKPAPDPEPTEEDQLELVRLKTEAENNCEHINNLENWYKKHKGEMEILPPKLYKEIIGHITVLKKQLTDAGKGE